MNERIFELAKQADLIQWDTLPSGARTPDHASVVKAIKFAELIVQECAKVLTRHGSYFSGEGEPYHYAASLIEEHFGVEE